MAGRRNVSSSLSAQVITHLRQRGYTQAQIARMLRVSESFISLVKSKDRSLTLDHLERLSEALSVPLGALLLSVTQRPRASGDTRKLFKLSEQVMKQADDARRLILRGAASPVR